MSGDEKYPTKDLLQLQAPLIFIILTKIVPHIPFSSQEGDYKITINVMN